MEDIFKDVSSEAEQARRNAIESKIAKGTGQTGGEGRHHKNKSRKV